ncbi:helix-turn-helix transcriptional regulator [Thermomonas sp. HDW16]|uniref:helix-turn-helix domain-containing protein n=1 Tax=Thermomonas sp. HDW16 TaxID=2714945 RepID=UPI00140B9BFB|nr:helix-turn-helix transcriptional regulator [Thermomonas sp. HDW16]QIL20174.1 helix-turn-helix transcriptional regulator [Thermomonas sp. HDW16]
MPKTLYSEEAKLLQRQLRDAREQAGITQASLSEAMGRGQSFISDIERGVRRLDVVELWFLCNALGLDLTSFVGEFQKAVESRPGKRIKRLRRNDESLPRKRS